MALCPNEACRAPVEGKARFCPACGTPLQGRLVGAGGGITKSVGEGVFIDRSQTTYIWNAPGSETCPRCHSELQAPLKTCQACHTSYCSGCEISGIACPACGTPYLPLRKLVCCVCHRHFAIAERDLSVVRRRDTDPVRGVKQRCVCPLCHAAVYLSGSRGFVDLGAYKAAELKRDEEKAGVSVVSLEKFAPEMGFS